jgi:hypothetical protein
MTSILGAISPHGVVNVKVRIPRVAASSKKRKLGNDKEEKKEHRWHSYGTLLQLHR